MAENPYEPFMGNVKDSIYPVLHVARWAVKNGHDVLIKGMNYANSYEEWEENADAGYDLVIGGKTINVKHNNRPFGSIEEFANNFKNFERPFLVSAVHVESPDVVFILSNDLRGGIKIPKEHKEHWGIRKGVFDPRYKTKQDCYDVGPEYVEWLSLE